VTDMGHMGEGAGSPFTTMWPGPRPTCMPSFILIRPAVWPQYTNVTDRQTDRTDRQRSDSIWRKRSPKDHARVIFHPCAGTPPLGRLSWILAYGVMSQT